MSSVPAWEAFSSAAVPASRGRSRKSSAPSSAVAPPRSADTATAVRVAGTISANLSAVSTTIWPPCGGGLKTWHPCRRWSNSARRRVGWLRSSPARKGHRPRPRSSARLWHPRYGKHTGEIVPGADALPRRASRIKGAHAEKGHMLKHRWFEATNFPSRRIQTLPSGGATRMLI